jgi:hypothetical protein
MCTFLQKYGNYRMYKKLSTAKARRKPSEVRFSLSNLLKQGGHLQLVLNQSKIVFICFYAESAEHR